jgi:hypothetical protein
VRPARDRSRRLRSVAIGELRVPGLAPPAPRLGGRFDSGCGGLALNGTALRVSGLVERLDAGRALAVRGCGRLRLPAGESDLSSPPGAVFRPDHLRLASLPPRPSPPASRPRVVDPGEGWNGSRDGVRLELGGPAWLVLAESWSKGWRAWCTTRSGEEHELGGSVPIDAFANGWRAPPACTSARFEFTPQKLAIAAYAVSAAGGLAMLAFLVLSVVRGRRPRPRAGLTLDEGPAADPLVRLPWRWALAAGAVAGVVGGFVFALRAGAVLAPATVLAVRAGIGARRLLAAAALLMAALPFVYLAFPARDRGGNEFRYPVDLLGAHWLAVGATVCLAGAGVLLAHRLRGARRPVLSSPSAFGSRSSRSAPREPAGSGR